MAISIQKHANYEIVQHILCLSKKCSKLEFFVIKHYSFPHTACCRTTEAWYKIQPDKVWQFLL